MRVYKENKKNFGCLGSFSTSDFSVYSYPGGMLMPGRHSSSADYRFGYNGMEMDNEPKGNGNSYTTEFRQYDPRLMRWLSLDPLMMKFPWMSPYVAFDNNPIFYIDPYGLESGPGSPDDTGGNDGDIIDPDAGSEHADNAGNNDDYGGPYSIAKGKKEPGVGRDMGSRKIPKYSPGGTPIQNPQPIYDEIGAGSNVKNRVQLSDEELLSDFKNLLHTFATTEYSKKIVNGIYEHFKENTGDDYSSWELTNQANHHPSVHRFTEQIADAFQKSIDAGGDYFGDENFSIQEYLIGNPRFNEFLDNFNGLRISVNDVWSYDVSVSTYKEVDGKWVATINLTLYDHFGLDQADINNNPYAESYPGFYSWYILQHARGYKPFVTVMHIPEFKIHGVLKK